MCWAYQKDACWFPKLEIILVLKHENYTFVPDFTSKKDQLRSVVGLAIEKPTPMQKQRTSKPLFPQKNTVKLCLISFSMRFFLTKLLVLEASLSVPHCHASTPHVHRSYPLNSHNSRWPWKRWAPKLEHLPRISVVVFICTAKFTCKCTYIYIIHI